MQACKQEKEYWKNQYNHMQNVLANCHPYNPQPYPPYPPQPNPPSGGGWVGGKYYSDVSGICG